MRWNATANAVGVPVAGPAGDRGDRLASGQHGHRRTQPGVDAPRPEREAGLGQEHPA
jgi:hypothetical protein